MAVLSVVIPCYNEEKTLSPCVQRVLALKEHNISLEIIIVDDGSGDHSVKIARTLAKKHSEIRFFQHDKNQGKGATLRTGFQYASGDFVCVQDADLEYDPEDLIGLIGPLQDNKADVVLGSRFLSTGSHRVLYFWHSMGNKFLTFLSNMFTDLNVTDMETCYKVFRREILQQIQIQEDRFGFEPEIVAKVAQMRVRVYEMGISYSGRTYEEGKKIGLRDGIRALYCIVKYNAPKAPLPIQLLVYCFIGSIAATINLSLFTTIFYFSKEFLIATPIAFFLAAIANYFLCIYILFRRNVQWGTFTEWGVYLAIVGCLCPIDTLMTIWYTQALSLSPILAKALACLSLFPLNFFGRRFLVFPEQPSGPWKPQGINPISP